MWLWSIPNDEFINHYEIHARPEGETPSFAVLQPRRRWREKSDFIGVK